MPGVGAGVSSSQSPGLDCALMSAFIVVVIVNVVMGCVALAPVEFQHPGEDVHYDGFNFHHARRFSGIVNGAILHPHCKCSSSRRDARNVSHPRSLPRALPFDTSRVPSTLMNSIKIACPACGQHIACDETW